MAASAIWIDRPVEREVVAGDAVQRRLGSYLMEADAHGFGRIESADALNIEAWKPSLGLAFDTLLLPAHERMFA